MNNPFVSIPATAPADVSLDDLGRRYLAAKDALADAQRKVLDAEQAIIDATGSEDEGAFTVRSELFKITTTQPVNRSVDKDALQAIRREFPEDLFEAMFDFKPSLNVKLFKECQHLRPEVYALACKAVTSKPGKISVKVEPIANPSKGEKA